VTRGGEGEVRGWEEGNGGGRGGGEREGRERGRDILYLWKREGWQNYTYLKSYPTHTLSHGT